MTQSMNDSVSAAELRLMTAKWRSHAIDCPRCRTYRDAIALHLSTTINLCPTGQRLHGAAQGIRARIATSTNGGRPALKLVQGGAA